MSVLEFKPKKKKIQVDVNQIIDDCTDIIFDDWAKHYRAGTLNEYIVESVPTWCAPDFNYVGDLSAIADVQEKMEMAFQVISPGIEFEKGKHLGGWICLFRIADTLANTPPMITEAHARCFAVLLRQKIARELSSCNM